MKKFSITTNTMVKYGRKLFQIKAEMNFGNVKKGDLGGWVESEESLSDSAWVHVDAVVFKRARIHDGVIHGGEIWGGEIHDGVIHGGEIWGGEIHDGEIRGGEIRGGVIRGGEIWGGEIWGGEIWGGVVRGGEIHDGVIHGGEIWGGEIHDGEIRGGEIHDGVIRGGVIRGGVIKRDNHIGVSNVGSENGFLLAYVDNHVIMVSRGCFHGTIDEFYRKVESHHGDNKHGRMYKALRPVIEMKLKGK